MIMKQSEAMAKRTLAHLGEKKNNCNSHSFSPSICSFSEHEFLGRCQKGMPKGTELTVKGGYKGNMRIMFGYSAFALDRMVLRVLFNQQQNGGKQIV